ncbi:MAG: helix-turn-helix domain-containing protein [Ruminococcus sp.]|nr:helix-turn-helix domain-containing protein [Ruminococcus sp.]
MAENYNENKIVMLTIKEAAALVEGLTEYRVRQMCINGQVPHIMAGKKYLINKELFLRYLRGETA